MWKNLKAILLLIILFSIQLQCIFSQKAAYGSISAELNDTNENGGFQDWERSNLPLYEHQNLTFCVLYENGTFFKDINFEDIKWNEIDQSGIKSEMGIGGFESTYGSILWYPYCERTGKLYTKPLWFTFQRFWAYVGGTWYRKYITNNIPKTPFLQIIENNRSIGGNQTWMAGWKGIIDYAGYEFDVSLAILCNRIYPIWKLKTNVTTPINLQNHALEYQFYVNPYYVDKVEKNIRFLRVYFKNESFKDYDIMEFMDITVEIPDIVERFTFLLQNRSIEANILNFEDLFSKGVEKFIRIEEVVLPNGAQSYVLKTGATFGALGAGETMIIDPTYEDFTTYTEVDPNSHISIPSAHHIDANIYEDEDAYVYSDKGEDFFDDFEHLLEVTADSFSTTWCTSPFWATTNAVDDTYGLQVADETYLYMAFCSRSSPTSLKISLRKVEDGVLSNTAWNEALLDTKYYIRIHKEDTDLYAEIRTGSHEGTLQANLTRTLSSDYKFRYVFGVVTHNRGYAKIGYLDIENLDLQAEPIPSDIAFTTEVVGASCIFSTKWTHISKMSGYIFGTNNTGSWVNDTWVGWSPVGSPKWSNVTKTLTSVRGARIEWQIWANNTVDVWGDTELQSFYTVIEVEPLNQSTVDTRSIHGYIYHNDYLYACHRYGGRVSKINAQNYSDYTTVVISRGEAANASQIDDILEADGYIWVIDYDGYLYKLNSSDLSTISYILLLPTGGFSLCQDDTYIFAGGSGGYIGKYRISDGTNWNNSIALYGVFHSILEDGNYLYMNDQYYDLIRKVQKTDLTQVSSSNTLTTTDDMTQDSDFVYAGIEESEGGVVRVKKTDMTVLNFTVDTHGASYGIFVVFNDRLVNLDIDHNKIWVFEMPSLAVTRVVQIVNLTYSYGVNELAIDGYNMHLSQWHNSFSPIIRLTRQQVFEEAYTTYNHNSGGIFRVNSTTVTNGTETWYSIGTDLWLELAGLTTNSSFVFMNFTWDANYNSTNPYVLNFTISSDIDIWCYFDAPVAPITYLSGIFLFAVLASLFGFISFVAIKLTRRRRW